MTTYKELLTNGQSVTITLASLANAAYRQSTAIDNTANQDFDAGVMVKIKTNAAGTSASGYVGVWAYGSADGGTTYTDSASGSDAAFTPTIPQNIKYLGTFNANVNATPYVGGPFSVADGFGYLPGKWGVIIQNVTGAALDSTGANFSTFYERLQGTSA